MKPKTWFILGLIAACINLGLCLVPNIVMVHAGWLFGGLILFVIAAAGFDDMNTRLDNVRAELQATERCFETSKAATARVERKLLEVCDERNALQSRLDGLTSMLAGIAKRYPPSENE